MGVFSTSGERASALAMDLSVEARAYWVGMNRVQGIGPVKFRLLLDYFQNDLAAAWRADARELAHAGLPRHTLEKFLAQRATIEPERELERLEKEKVGVLTWCDAAYPPLL